MKRPSSPPSEARTQAVQAAGASPSRHTKKLRAAPAVTPKAREGYRLPAPTYERDHYSVAATGEGHGAFGAGAHAILMRHGAVIPGMLTPDEAAATYQGLLGALETTFLGMFTRDRPETWRALHDHRAKHAMLLQTHGLGWCQAAVDVRQHPSVPGVFAGLWSAGAALRASRRSSSGAILPPQAAAPTADPPPLRPDELLSSADASASCPVSNT